MFKWACLAVVVIIGGTLLWMVNDLRRDAKPVLTDLKRDMPTIVANTKKSTTSLAELSDDIKAVRTIMGLTGSRDKKLIVYTGEVLELIEKEGAGATIFADTTGAGIANKIVRFVAAKNPVTVENWLAATRARALYVSLFGGSTKEDVLDKLCKDTFGNHYMIQVGSADPVLLKDWIQQHQPKP